MYVYKHCQEKLSPGQLTILILNIYLSSLISLVIPLMIGVVEGNILSFSIRTFFFILDKFLLNSNLNIGYLPLRLPPMSNVRNALREMRNLLPGFSLNRTINPQIMSNLLASCIIFKHPFLLYRPYSPFTLLSCFKYTYLSKKLVFNIPDFLF